MGEAVPLGLCPGPNVEHGREPYQALRGKEGHRKGTVHSIIGPGTRARALEGLGSSGRYQQGERGGVKTVRAQCLMPTCLQVPQLHFLSISPCVLEGAGQKITQDPNS